jgi:Beta-propeller domains of methanol dehydrogenase type
MKYLTEKIEMHTTKTKLVLAFLLLLSANLFAQIPSRPVPPRLVNDYTGTLSAAQQMQLERKLVAYDDSTSTQILVVVVDDLQGYTVEEYAYEIAQSWGVGQKKTTTAPSYLSKSKQQIAMER